MRLRPHHIKSCRALAIGVAVGVTTFGIPPMAAHATTPNCETITATWGSETPVQIDSPDELYCIGEGEIDYSDPDINNINTLGLDFQLASGIELTTFIEGTPWRPIGSSLTPFTGSLDGGGNTISGLMITTAGVDQVGLFASIRNASISDLRLTAPTVAGGNDVGSLVGQATDSVISGITATSVNVTANAIDAVVGGLIGFMTHSRVTNVSVTGSVSASNTHTWDDFEGIGGVIGRISDDPDPAIDTAPMTVVESVDFSGDVEGPALVGGVIGHADTDPTNDAKWMALRDLSSSGTVSSTEPFDSDLYHWAIGGALGLVFDADLSDIRSTSTVSSSVGETGGLIGALVDSQLRVASSTGNVTVDTVGDSCYVGGLIGTTFSWFAGGNALIIEDVSASGNVSCTGGQDTGGLIGYAAHTNVTNARVVGNVTASGVGGVHVGGLIGTAYDSTFTEVSADGDVIAESNFVGGLIGIAQRTAEATSRDVIITQATTSGAVRGRSNVGGIVGGGENANAGAPEGSIQVIESSSSSSVTGIQSVGGIAGGGGGDFVLRDVVSRGSITGWLEATDGGAAPSPANYGGLVGYLSGTGSIERAYTTSTLTTDVDPTGSTIGSMIGVSDGTLTGLSFTSTDPDTLQIAGTLAAASSENAEYRSLTDLGEFDTYDSWNASSPNVIVNEWVSPSSRSTQVWGTCATVNSGLPFLQWQRTEACPAAPNPPSPSPDNGGTGGNSASDSGSSQSPSASGAGGSGSASQASSNESLVTSTGNAPTFRQPAAPQQVTGAVTLVPADVAAATPTRAMRQEASATLGSAPTVMATANQPVKLMVPGFTPGGTYTVQVKSNKGYVVLGSVQADANGQLQMPVFRMKGGSSTTKIAIMSATGEASYVKVKTTKKRGAGERNRTRGAAAGNRR